jgi:uncharacterized membrane protein YvbJ
MYCRKCGFQNAADAYKCFQCGESLEPVVASTTPVKIDNNLVLAIVVTVFCCLPFGVVGIVYAAQVNAKAQVGDIAGAQESARKARMWSLLGLGLFLGAVTLWFIAVVLVGLAGVG